MKQLRIRFAKKDEADQIIEWLNANKDNKFDPDIISYPTLQILCSHDETGSIAYLPIQTVFMLESAAHSPRATVGQLAQSFRDFVKATQLLSSREGIREIYFLDGANGIGEMSKGHGFEELPYKVYRMKL